MTQDDDKKRLNIKIQFLSRIEARLTATYFDTSINDWTSSPDHYRQVIRLLHSRKRALMRDYLIKYGDVLERYLANKELQMNTDDGSQITIDTRQHQVGWFGCKGCDIFEGERMSMLCTFCRNGVMHYMCFPEGAEWTCDQCSTRLVETPGKLS
jgi:hypothetical protein